MITPNWGGGGVSKVVPASAPSNSFRTEQTINNNRGCYDFTSIITSDGEGGWSFMSTQQLFYFIGIILFCCIC